MRKLFHTPGFLRRDRKQIAQSKSEPQLRIPDSTSDASNTTNRDGQENDMNRSTATFNDSVNTNNASTQTLSRAAMPSYTAPRNVSGPSAIDTNATNPDSNTSTSTWYRTNPHTTPNSSKTSLFIDKVTAENDRLKRELTAEKLAREDEVKRVAAARTKAEDTRAEYQHLQILAETNARAIERKDRKLEELKAALEAEARRRQAAEQRAEEALKLMGDTKAETQRYVSEAYEKKYLAEANANAARQGYIRQCDAYEAQLHNMRDELKYIRRQRIEEAGQVERQNKIIDNLRHEMKQALRDHDQMTDMMGKYKAKHRKEVDALAAEAEQMRNALPSKEKEADNLVAELQETLQRMNWVMAQKKQQDGP